jgi:carboxymethylenebutenolidase
MCYDNDARPPLPPDPGGPATGTELVLRAADGNEFLAYAAQPAGPAAAQVLIYPDVRGLHPFYQDLALRFATVGVAALALDYFGRTAGLGPRDDAFEFGPHVEQMQLPTFYADVTAALAYLRRDSGAERATFVLGFCRGGALALLSGTEDFGLAGLVAFYSGLSRDLGSGTALQHAARVRVPVLGLFGGADPGIPPEQVEELDRQLDRAGVPHEIVSYPGAPHSFFDRKAVEFAAESADAWRRVLRFIAAHSGNPAS